MPQPITTTIGGVKYACKLLGGRDARVVGLLVTSAALRGIAVAMAKADLSKVVKSLQSLPDAKEGETPEGRLSRVMDSISWSELGSMIGGVADGGATLLEMIGPDGLETLDKAFTAQTTAWLPSDVPGAQGVFEVALSNREDHWVGRWPQYLQWLAWEVRANGFFPDLGALIARSKPQPGTGGAPEPQPQATT